MSTILDSIHWLPPARDLLRLLLDAGLKSVAVLAVAGVAVACLRRRSAAARYLVCFLAVASLPALPVLSWALPGWRVLPAWMEFREPPSRPARSTLSTPSTPSAPSTLFAPSGIPPVPRRFPTAPPATPELAPPAQVPLPAVPIVAAPKPPPARAEMDAWSAGLLAWLAGVLLALAPVVLGLFSLHRLERASRRETAASWLDLLRQLLTRLGCKRRVVLLKAARRRMPMTWGVLRPKVLLPEESQQWPPERRGVVLLHELAHAKRCDYLTHLLTRLVCALYWFNPLVWLAARRMVAERERACDDIVLRHGAQPADYAEQVLEISAGLSPGWFANCGGVAMARPSNLESRLRAILDAKRNRAAVTRWAVVSALLLLTGILVPLAMLKAAPGLPSANPPASAGPTAGRQSDWGDAIEGVAVRLQADRARWGTNEHPALTFDVRNQGERDFTVSQLQEQGRLEVDGVWHDWFGSAGGYAWLPSPLPPPELRRTADPAHHGMAGKTGKLPRAASASAGPRQTHSPLRAYSPPRDRSGGESCQHKDNADCDSAGQQSGGNRSYRVQRGARAGCRSVGKSGGGRVRAIAFRPFRLDA